MSTYFVTGATGNQGGATARHLASKGYKVIALTRNANSTKAQELSTAGIRVVQGNLDDPDTYRHHLVRVDGVFSVQTFIDGVEKEIKQGTMLADMAKAHNVPHFIYTSVSGAELKTSIPHWESKAVIEAHIKKSGLHYTILRPASLYENFLLPQVKGRLLKGKLVLPVSKRVVQQHVSAEDVGRIASIIFSNPPPYFGRTIHLATEEMNQEELAEIFSKMLDKKIEFQQLPSIITRLFMGKRLHKMFSWVNKNSSQLSTDINAVQQEFPGMLGLKEWIRLKF